MDSQAIIDAIVSHAAALGRFERVNAHEPKSPPGSGLSCAVWVDRIAPVASSGLAATSALVVVNVRVYTNMLTEPADAIDPALMQAVDALLAALSSDLDLGGQVRCVDLIGQTGTALSAQAGYLTQDSRLYRVMTVTVPLIVNDAWTQQT